MNLILLILALLIFWPPFVHFVGYIRHYKFVRRTGINVITALLQSLALFLFYPVLITVFFYIGKAFNYPLIPGPAILMFILTSLFCWIPHRPFSLFNLPFVFLYAVTRIPVDKTVPAFWDRLPPATFINRSDEYLFQAAIEHWRRSGLDEATLANAASSAEARGQILGRLIDERSNRFRIATGDLVSPARENSFVLRPPILFSSRLLLSTYVIAFGIILNILIRDGLWLPNQTDAAYGLQCTLAFIFGAIFAIDPAIRFFAELFGLLALCGAFLPLPLGRPVMVTGMAFYFQLSLAALDKVQGVWDELVSVRIMSYLDGTLFSLLDTATAGMASLLRAVLGFGLSNLLGFSFCLWLVYAARVLLVAFGPEGRLFFGGVFTRPDIYGGLRPDIPSPTAPMVTYAAQDIPDNE